MSEHYAVVRRDMWNLNHLVKYRPLTEEDIDKSWECIIVCSDRDNCPGWIECTGDHTGFEDDGDEPEETEDVLIHGELHEWNWGYGWCVEMGRCPVESVSGSLETPDEVDMTRAGKYLLDVDWEETECYIDVVKEVEND